MKNKKSASSNIFPKDFMWGVATSAPQIEGAWNTAGKGPSIWDHPEVFPGNRGNGDSLHTACDHYNRFRSDFSLMRKLGIRNYRFSAAWPRICPEGSQKVNSKGLDFYDRLVDSMLQNEIEPWCTLFHWDLPMPLEELGGWPNRHTVEMFSYYAQALVKRLGDRVRRWFTVNEIFCFVNAGYEHGLMAPFRKESKDLVRRANHHALLAHGHGVAIIRSLARKDSKIGFAFNPGVFMPLCEKGPDLAASRQRFREINGLHLDPVFLGKYPAAYLEEGKDPGIQDGDLKLISQKTDFVGYNVYTGTFVRDGKKGKPEDIVMTPHFPRSDCSWMNLTPQAIYWALKHTDDIYGKKKFYITENGASYPAEPDGSDEVNDVDRIQYLKNYLKECKRVIHDGCDLRGYFLWSFIDNYEWTSGYRERFGIVHVDFATQKRTPKMSAYWYREVMRQNRVL